MKLKLFLLAFTISVISYAQDYNVAMQVSKSDLENNYYEKDSTANALVIYDYGNSFVDKKTFWLTVQVKQKVKILRTEGVEKGEYEVRLYKGKSSKEKILKIRGATYNLENGSIEKTELAPNAIFREENENYTLVKFVLPNVKVGSVITVSYETQSRFMSKFQPWYFQGPDPVLYSEYNTSIPGNYEYNIKLVGTLPLDTHDSKIEKHCITLGNGTGADCSISKYVIKNIPAYKPEGFTTTSQNYISRIEYELSVIRGFDGRVDKISKTWADVDKELRVDSDFGRQISKKSLVKKLLPSDITSLDDETAKAKAIYQFVLDNYKWNNKAERYDVSIKNLVKEKVGSAFEINLLLENLLTSQGFKVFPILMSTRANGHATKIYPVLTEFNYVILKTTIDGKDYFLDATDPYLSFGELPFRCLNLYGRLIDFEDGSYWQNIKVDQHSFRQHRVKLNSFKNETFSGVVESKFTGYHAHDLKRVFNENPQNYKEKKTDSYTDIDITEHEIVNFDKNGYEFNEKINVSLEPEFIGGKIYLNPFLIKFFEENPFKLQERTYPIDFGYKDIYSYVMLIDLGDDLKIIETPPSINYALPNKSGSFLFNVVKEGNQLIINFKVNFDNTIYAPELYQHLKNFMKKVVETQNNTVIVLEKQ
ncbi:transglutaminase-like enzyme; cysteine protease [Flavobacteriales bacterium ALC-1]|nr:transglutaminase-like enzyme; cysteine protease [Flavobacteriales bacterium ALC-1]